MKRNCSMLCFLVILLGNLQVYCQDGADRETSNQVENIIDVVNYLSEYGFIEQSGDTERLITEDVLTEAIAAFQRRYQLNVTGILDDETKALMSTPRCGNPDIDQGGYGGTRKKRFEQVGQRWPSNVVTWFIEGSTNDLPFAQVHEEIRTAFQRWENATALTFDQTDNSFKGDIRLSFHRRNHNDGDAFDGPGGVLGHAFLPPRSSSNPQGGNVHFDDDELFRTDLTNQGIILHQVATHEIGHSLGLGHSEDRNAVMAPFYRPVSPSSFQLQQDDINGIQAIYGKPIIINNPPPAPATPPPMPPTTPTTKATAAPTTPTRTMPPIFCNGQFDAVTEAFNASSLYLFQGNLVFRYIISQKVIVPGYPKPVWEEFAGVPGFIDAALTYVVAPTYRVMYLYKGDNYWRFDNRVAVAGYPKSITSNWGGVPANLDATFIWTGNRLWYFIKDNQYYKFNLLKQAVDAGYPRPLSVWRGVSPNVDAVATYDGTTYFFGGQYYQRFNDSGYYAYPQSQTAPNFLGCITRGPELLETTEIPTTDTPTTEIPTTEIPTTLLGDSGSTPLNSRFTVVLFSLVIYLLNFVNIF